MPLHTPPEPRAAPHASPQDSHGRCSTPTSPSEFRQAEVRHRIDLARRQVHRNLKALRRGQGRRSRKRVPMRERHSRSLKAQGREQEASSRRPSRRLQEKNKVSKDQDKRLECVDNVPRALAINAPPMAPTARPPAAPAKAAPAPLLFFSFFSTSP